MDLDLDADGYLRDLDAWNMTVARQLATLENIELDERYDPLIHLIRDYYAQKEVSPAMRPLVKLIRSALGEEIGNSIYLMTLFPESPAKQLARIAGLPRPTNCL